MDFVGFPKIARYSRDCVISEKIDGTNGQIYIPALDSIDAGLGGPFLVGSRSRWITPECDNYGFAKWAYDHFEELLKFGPGRHFGEWWGQGIQRGYGLKEKRFSLFNVHRWIDPLVRPACCHVVPTLSWGEFTTDHIERTLRLLKLDDSFAAPGFMNPEGIVIYHMAGNLLFKKTFMGDEGGKGEQINAM